MTAQSRQPAGVPAGGQFAAGTHAEATGVVLKPVRTPMGSDLAALFAEPQPMNPAELQPGDLVVLKDRHRPAEYGTFVEVGEMETHDGRTVPTLRVDFGGEVLGRIPVLDGQMPKHVRVDFGS